MAKYSNEVSRTFSEYLLIPGLTDKNCNPSNVSLKAPLVSFRKGEQPEIRITSYNVCYTKLLRMKENGRKEACSIKWEQTARKIHDIYCQLFQVA